VRCGDDDGAVASREEGESDCACWNVKLCSAYDEESLVALTPFNVTAVVDEKKSYRFLIRDSGTVLSFLAVS
jgi:hypothetical protein